MNKRFVGYAIGKLLQIISAILLVPFGIAAFENRELGFPDLLIRGSSAYFLTAIVISLLSGLLLTYACRNRKEFQGTREGFAVVTFGWSGLALVGCLPLGLYFLLQGDGITLGRIVRCFSDSYFETMSGFTTTGATILTNIEIMPKSLLFWRSLTHWLGGMGIITLALFIFPALGVSGYQMFRGEVPGPTAERILPRLTETAKVLWGVYALLSLAETVLLALGGMPLFEALCHTFGTMATGGFSTMDASIGHYKRNYFEWVIIVFMFLAGVNFMIHYRVILLGKIRAFHNSEFLFYLGTVTIAVVFFTGLLYVQGLAVDGAGPKFMQAGSVDEQKFLDHVAQEKEKISTLYGCFRYAAFQVVSITTTTGYCTADFDLWPNAARIALVVLMFWGGCIGSTGGGMKMGRILILLKAGLRETYKMVKPRVIAPIKIQRNSVEEELVKNILSFALLFVSIFVVGSFLMSLIVPDVETAVSSVIATLGNIGPGLAGIGATQNYAWIPLVGKWILTLCMLLGRLEVFTVLAVFLPSVWRK